MIRRSSKWYHICLTVSPVRRPLRPKGLSKSSTNLRCYDDTALKHANDSLRGKADALDQIPPVVKLGAGQKLSNHPARCSCVRRAVAKRLRCLLSPHPAAAIADIHIQLPHCVNQRVERPGWRLTGGMIVPGKG